MSHASHPARAVSKQRFVREERTDVGTGLAELRCCAVHPRCPCSTWVSGLESQPTRLRLSHVYPKVRFIALSRFDVYLKMAAESNRVGTLVTAHFVFVCLQLVDVNADNFAFC